MSSASALAGWVAAGITGAMAVAVRRALGQRMEAVARACHELRGPLTAARLGLSLSSRVGELSPDRLRVIDSELGRASLALADLAEAGRRGPRLGNVERVDVLGLMIDCVRACDGLAEREGATLCTGWRGERVTVWGDRLRLAQAVGNLITNAIVHGGAIVQVEGGVRASAVRIEVSDDGPGLSEPIAELIRHPRRGRGAHGRGLAIAVAIAEAHGGRLVSAPAREGARIALELPLPLDAPPAG